jgi:hypothetical protein
MMPRNPAYMKRESGKNLGHRRLVGSEFGGVTLIDLDLGSRSWNGRSGWR